MTTETSTIPETLRTVADHIEKVGLEQSGSYFGGGITDAEYCAGEYTDKPCCVVGGIAVVAGIRPSEAFWSPAALSLRDGLLRRGEELGLTLWNDVTPPARVLATIREIADELEAENA